MSDEDVPEKLRLAYYVGQIVINDSYAEHEAQVLWNILQDGGIVGGRRPQMFGRLLPALELAFRSPSVPAVLGGIAGQLLERTSTWHRYRRDLVHDLLADGWGRRGEVQSALGKHPPRPIEALRECAVGLQQSMYSLRGMRIITPYWLGREGDGWESAEGLRSWTRVAMGEIADVPGTIVGTVGPAPEPAGGWDAIVAAAESARERSERSEIYVSDEGS